VKLIVNILIDIYEEWVNDGWINQLILAATVV
jgi:hypothetical protein